MKTIRQIAKEIGVTRQAVYYKINRPPLSECLEPLLSKENGVLTVSEYGETLIKQAFLTNGCQACSPTVDTSFDTLTKLLCSTVETLNDQLKIKDYQIRSLTSVAEKQAENARPKYYGKAFSIRNKRKKKATSVPIKRLMNT